MDIKSKIKNLFKKITFNDIRNNDYIYLYAGDIPDKVEYDKKGIVGLSITHADHRTIRHDITKAFLLDDDTVDIFQAEDVFEHIEYEKLVQIVNEIYRVLKPGGIFRLSVPDYRCDILYERSLKDHNERVRNPYRGMSIVCDCVKESKDK